ncbi:MAG: hypothetical protein M0Z36_11040 [Thermaerobacter sp.]|nr:hypothetical protein [Thermaerobacter sp.]
MVNEPGTFGELYSECWRSDPGNPRLNPLELGGGRVYAVHDDVRGVADGVLQVNARLEQFVTEQFQQHDKRLMRL